MCSFHIANCIINNRQALIELMFVFPLVIHFKVIIGGLESCGDIVSVSCTENEIFILKGDRDIMRISNCPEGLISNSKTFLCHLDTLSHCFSTFSTLRPPIYHRMLPWPT